MRPMLLLESSQNAATGDNTIELKLNDHAGIRHRG